MAALRRKNTDVAGIQFAGTLGQKAFARAFGIHDVKTAPILHHDRHRLSFRVEGNLINGPFRVRQRIEPRLQRRDDQCALRRIADNLPLIGAIAARGIAADSAAAAAVFIHGRAGERAAERRDGVRGRGRTRRRGARQQRRERGPGGRDPSQRGHPHAPAGALRAEASTSYLTAPDAPDRIAAVAPDARIAILLRDPVERAWAHHRSDRAAGDERRGFLRAIRDELQRPARWGVEPVYLGAGHYADGLGRYLDRFGPDRVWVRFTEWVDPSPTRAARDLLEWLGRDPGPLTDPPAASAVPTPARRRGSWLDALRGRSSAYPALEPTMDETIRRLLEDAFAPDVARVRDLLGVIPPWSVVPAP